MQDEKIRIFVKKMSAKSIADYIQQRRALFWYSSPDKTDISLSFLTEMVLNYGTLDDVRELFVVAGVNKIAKVFRESTQKSKRDNYFPIVKNFYTLYFDKYAPRDTK